jgi:acyl carrier protein
MQPLQTADALRVLDLSLRGMPRMIAMPIDWQVVAPHLDWSMKVISGEFIQGQDMPELVRRSSFASQADLVQMLRSAVSKVSQMDVGKLDNEKEFQTLGLDSLMLKELSEMVNEEFGAQVLSSMSVPELEVVA